MSVSFSSASYVTVTKPKAQKLESPVEAQDTSGIIVAGGTGERFGDPRGKQFVDLLGLPLLSWSILAFDRAKSVKEIIIVACPDKFKLIQDDIVSKLKLHKTIKYAEAGKTRQESVYSGLQQVDRRLQYCSVHDAARPLVESEMIEATLLKVRNQTRVAGAICAAPAIDTLKIVDGSIIVATPNRASYWCAQTPQTFRTQFLLQAHKTARIDNFQGTDDASLVERIGGVVSVVETTRDNIKVTIPSDLAIVEASLAQRLMNSCLGDDVTGERE